MQTSCPPDTFTSTVTLPKFRQNQQVAFLGGTGIIRTCRPDAGNWTYAIEMELGPEPDVGRVGPETTILLHESDIQSVLN